MCYLNSIRIALELYSMPKDTTEAPVATFQGQWHTGHPVVVEVREWKHDKTGQQRMKGVKSCGCTSGAVELSGMSLFNWLVENMPGDPRATEIQQALQPTIDAECKAAGAKERALNAGAALVSAKRNLAVLEDAAVTAAANVADNQVDEDAEELMITAQAAEDAVVVAQDTIKQLEKDLARLQKEAERLF